MEEASLTDAARYLEHWLDHRQRSLQVPGLVAAVALDGHLLLHRAYGAADLASGAPMTTDHVFPVASHSKTFTAVLVLRLVEQGRLRLDDRVADLLPDLLPSSSAIRVRDLLSHSSGLARDGADSDHWNLERPFPSRADLGPLVEQVLPRHQRFKYSNIGFALLGQVVQRATGSPYDEVARTELLEPLGLHETHSDVLPGRTYATGHTSRRGGRQRQPLELPATGALAPATGYCSTAAELCRFATALCDGPDGLLEDDSRREMRRVAWQGDSGDQDYGLGLSSTLVGERRVHGHGGAFPGFITATRFDPERRLVVVVLANAIDAPSPDLTLTMHRILALAGDCAPGLPPAAGRPGRYSGLWSTTDVVAFGSQLMALDPELADPVDRRIELEPDPVDPDALRIGRSSGYSSPGERVSFSSASMRLGGLTLGLEQPW